MSALPTGTVTFFFSDIEGSTRLLETLGAEYSSLLERHRAIVRDEFNRTGGIEVGTQGDSFFAVFPSATHAVAAAVAIQRAIAQEQWAHNATVRVRIGLHTGEARLAADDYTGIDVHRAARIMAAAHGGQILISEPTRAVVDRDAGDGIALRDLGEHRLRDLSARERLFQVVPKGVPVDFSPPRTLDVTPNNLPTQTTVLVGREAELSEIRHHLDAPNARLLSLTGPGGIGKTRLALQAAADQVERFRDGVYFVDLSAVRDAPAALRAIVHVVGVAVPAEADLRSALAEHLRARQVLLVLDNLEQVMQAADDVAELLKQCPQLTVLVTSREALRVRGEQLIPVSPLSLPNVAGAAATADQISPYPAVRLFVERAQEARPSFVLTDENAVVVAEICARLDGLPLAIELAAARLKLFSPDELKERLGSRLELLRGGARDLPARQRTLLGTIDWSYELLDDDERAVFKLLSLFSSAQVDAVERVASRVAALEAIDVVDRLASLVDKSLMRSEEDGRRQRLSMLDTIRDYAAQTLESDSAMRDEARRAHAEYFAEFAHSMRGDVHGSDAKALLDSLAAELGNLQTAWRYFVDAGDLGKLNTLLDALWRLHDARGWYHGAVALTNDLLDVLSQSPAAPERADDEITVRMTLARGLLAVRGYTQEVEELYRQALAVSEAAGALPKRLPVLRSLASFHLYRGEIDQTAAIGLELLELAEQEHDTGLQVEGHLIAGPATAFLGDPRGGLDHLERAIALFDPERHGRARFRLGPNPGVAARAVSGLLHWLTGYPDTAAQRAASALELAAELQHPYSLAYATFHVTLLDLWSRRLDVAHQRAGDVVKIAEEHDYRIWRALGLVLQGVSEAGLGHPEAGLARTEQGIALYENLRTPPVFWPNLLGLRAETCGLAGRSAEAIDLFDQAITLAGRDRLTTVGLLVQKGDLLLSLGDGEGAESWLRRAFDEAGRAGARMIQLRAATRLARLAAPARRSSATAVLREVFETFTEGFDTLDLLEARAVLAKAATVARP
jgi:predicted ATPase/class 3 adenylate cyclase